MPKLQRRDPDHPGGRFTTNHTGCRGPCCAGSCASGSELPKLTPAKIDLFAHPSVKNVIVLQTVLDSVKRASISVHNRVMQLINDLDKKFFLFYNRFHYMTFCPMEDVKGGVPKEMLAIVKACAWFRDHATYAVKPAIVSDNQNLREMASENNLNFMTVQGYVEIVPSNDSLADMIAVTDYKHIMDGRIYRYPDHLSISQIASGLRHGSLYSGKLDVEPHNIFEGTVICRINNDDKKISVIGRESINRGMDGDIVAISLLSEKDRTSEDMAVSDDEDSDSETAGSGLKTYRGVERASLGKVVGIIRRAWGVYCGNLDAEYIASNIRTDNSKIQTVYFWPYNKKIPRIRIGTRQISRLLNKRIAVSIDHWPKDSKYPIGHYVKTMGDIGDNKVETDIVLMENDIDNSPFSQKVLACLPPEREGWKVEPCHFLGRTDCTGLTVFSIDPPGCTDIDDALHCRKLSNGNFEVGIHIADVTFFIRPDTSLDSEARTRSTTVYLVDKRIDMIPPLLGTNLCSLKHNEKRLAVSCILELDKDANVVKRHFCRSVIQSKASMTYSQALAMVTDGRNNTECPDIRNSLLDLNYLAQKLRAKRREEGALALASPEMRFELGENLDVQDIKLKDNTASNILVEEFMLLANIEVANKIYSSYKRYSLLRRHPVPPRVKFEGLVKAVAKLGYKLNVENSKTLADSLDNIAKNVDPYLDYLIRMQVTRCMTQASYFSSGILRKDEFWHYGLSTPIYTHFTSPIRRYPDIMVHRILLASLGLGDINPITECTQEILTDICENANKKHYHAQLAARASAALYSSRFLIGSVIIEDGYVTRIMGNSFSAIIRKYGIEGIVKPGNTESTKLPEIIFDTENQTISVGGKVVIEAFKKVRIRLTAEVSDSKSSSKGRIKFTLIEPYIERFCNNSDLAS